jgi:hypothetical protein
MKVLRRLPNEDLRDLIVRYATDLTINQSGVGPDPMLDEFTFLVEEQGETEDEAAWSICEGYGLLDDIEAEFWDDEEGIAA